MSTAALEPIIANPMASPQAFDRAHRLGQKLDVSIYKLTIAGSVEDRILAVRLTFPEGIYVADCQRLPLSSKTKSANSRRPRCRAKAYATCSFRSTT